MGCLGVYVFFLWELCWFFCMFYMGFWGFYAGFLGLLCGFSVGFLRVFCDGSPIRTLML